MFRATIEPVNDTGRVVLMKHPNGDYTLRLQTEDGCCRAIEQVLTEQELRLFIVAAQQAVTPISG